MGLYAQVTLAISDQCLGGLEGFAPLSEELDEQVFHEAPADGVKMTDHDRFSVFLDLMDERDMQVNEKCISLAQAAAITGLEPEALVPLGRQRLAQINDEDAERCIRRTTPPQPEDN